MFVVAGYDVQVLHYLLETTIWAIRILSKSQQFAVQQAKQKRREDLVVAYPTQHRDEETECIQIQENSADTSGHWLIRAQEMQTNVEKEGVISFDEECYQLK
jgi:hypothetical protein